MAKPTERKPAPHKFPKTMEVVVEIPAGSRNKYEYDEEAKVIRLDRVLSSAVYYNFDYGFIEGTRADDGDHTDAMLLIDERTFPGCHVWARPVGVLKMADEKGVDFKVLCVALADPVYAHLEALRPGLAAQAARRSSSSSRPTRTWRTSRSRSTVGPASPRRSRSCARTAQRWLEEQAAAAAEAPQRPRRMATRFELLEVGGARGQDHQPGQGLLARPGLHQAGPGALLPRGRRWRAARRRRAAHGAQALRQRRRRETSSSRSARPTIAPDWIDTVGLAFPSGRTAEEIVLRDAAQLAWVANLGCLDLNPHPVRAEDLDHPDELRVDLDPVPGVPWSRSARWPW